MANDDTAAGPGTPGEATYKVPEGVGPERIDRVLAAVSGMSRGRVRRLMTVGAVYLDGKRWTRLATNVEVGSTISVVLHGEEAAAKAEERLARRQPHFVHRERTFAILRKPPGIAVQATRATHRGTLEAWLKDQDGVGYIAFHHRLDAQARGLLAVALHPSANRGLARAFQERVAQRTYRAVVEGRLEGEGVWEHDQVQRRGERRAVKVRGTPKKLMRSRWRSVHTGDERSVVEIRLETGRTHQIRLQAAAVGHAVVGDLLYGRSARGGLHLQAAALALPHPHTRKRMAWDLPVPKAWVS